MPSDVEADRLESAPKSTEIAETEFAEIVRAGIPGPHLEFPDPSPVVRADALRRSPPEIPEVEFAEFCRGEIASFSMKSPRKETANEDAYASIFVTEERGMLLVADGLGGHRGGRKASNLLKTSLTKVVPRLLPRPSNSILISKVIDVPVPGDRGEPDSRSVLLDQIEKVNKRLIRSRMGAGTTLALVEIKGKRVRTFHAGDSEILIMSQRGNLKYSTVSHSPIGYAFESGMMTEEEAILHPDRHLVSNVVGSDLMSIEMGPWITLSARDTVLLATDGLFDNLLQSEIVEILRIGRLHESVAELAEIAIQRMLSPMEDFPSKPDDLTILAYRGSRTRRKRKSEKNAVRK
ncbi:MAG: serine/threonine-protein phosphatase [Planctomycetaceae bacterium]|nr:serine/threonine-protein phosphatase [Planctomycetaceae bacterium]